MERGDVTAFRTIKEKREQTSTEMVRRSEKKRGEKRGSSNPHCKKEIGEEGPCKSSLTLKRSPPAGRVCGLLRTPGRGGKGGIFPFKGGRKTSTGRKGFPGAPQLRGGGTLHTKEREANSFPQSLSCTHQRTAGGVRHQEMGILKKGKGGTIFPLLKEGRAANFDNFCAEKGREERRRKGGRAVNSFISRILHRGGRNFLRLSEC